MGWWRKARFYLAITLVSLAGLGAVFQEDIRQLYFQPTDTGLNGSTSDSAEVETVATGLKVPWGIAFLPSGDMLVTERGGTLRRIGSTDRTYKIPGVEERGESGLLGVELHPDFPDNRYVYLYHTRETGNQLTNRVVRYRLVSGELTERKTIISGLPGAIYHDGGRLEFGPDGYLFVTVGDATDAEKAQDRNLMNGKILRLNPDGSIPRNPFNNPVYSYGHRNPQGLAFVNDQLWATEHGNVHRDELNRIVRAGNYGWPAIRGDESREGMIEPVIHSGSSTWAPAGAAYFNGSIPGLQGDVSGGSETPGSIFFAGLRGESLYEASIKEGDVVDLQAHFRKEFGRLRAVEAGPEGEYLYVTTSNRDGRGRVRKGDDRIIRVGPASLD